MALGNLKMLIAGGFLLGLGFVACAPTEDAGECSATNPCTQRGEACDEVLFECIAQELDVDATSDKPAPTSFSDVALPFFRGKVCMPTRVQPGDAIPVKFSPCVHPCVTSGGFTFKKQFSCSGAFCDAAVMQLFSGASGSGCPADTFGKFDKAQCVYGEDIKASAGPFTLTSGPIRGNASVEIPFLTNDDAAEIRDGANVDTIWALIKQYPQAQERVFAISMDGANPAAPADCSDESKCDCREIGF